MSLRPCVRTKVVLHESAQSRVYTVYTLHVNPNGTHCQQMCMSLVGHVLQLFVSPLSDHRHSTAAVKYPSRLKVMEAWFCFISPAGRCWLGLFWVSEQKTAPLKLINAIGDGRITSQTEWNQLSPLRKWRHASFVSHDMRFSYCYNSAITESLFSPTETHTCHSRTTGYQSKCITMNILGIIVLEFTDTQVVSKRDVLLC